MINKATAIIKRFLLLMIDIYQILLSPIVKQFLGTSRMCRYSPTCSEFAKNAIEEQGVLRGGKSALRRLLSCHPLAKGEKGITL
jgi:uncharacterized protein